MDAIREIKRKDAKSQSHLISLRLSVFALNFFGFSLSMLQALQQARL